MAGYRSLPWDGQEKNDHHLAERRDEGSVAPPVSISALAIPFKRRPVHWIVLEAPGITRLTASPKRPARRGGYRSNH
ncbi:MAG: hypothetical protein M0R28_04350 [Pigmentiphaga sp.]|nr:hypothetical protein [Pigmentiphaga sp.]